MKEALDIVKKHTGENSRLGVAVSGGPDSMCLLHILLGGVNKSRITVINVEHGIRGESSRRDSAFVRGYAEQNGLKVIMREADVPARRRESGRSEESEARAVRREIFDGLLAAGEVDFILTAHNAGDRTESVLMHILRGSSARGLIGPTEADGKYIRPLLYTPRTAIEGYVLAKNVPFVVDETNSDDRYTRNFLRHKVLPILRERFAADEALLRLSELAARDEDYFRSVVDGSVIEEENGKVYLPVAALCAHEAIASRYVLAAAARLGRTSDLGYANVKAAVGLAKTQSGRRVELGGGLVAAREFDRVVFYFGGGTVTEGAGAESGEEAPFAIGLTGFGEGYVTVTPCEPVVVKGRLRIDADRVPEGAVIRFRRDGDTFRPFGGGTKKLKEFLINSKIPLGKRDKIPLLCYNERVLAVFGVQIADDVRMSESTVSALELQFTEDDNG